MGKLALDILVIAALCKELLLNAPLLPVGFLTAAVLGIPFLLGMGSRQSDGFGIAWDPVGAFTRTGVALSSLIIFSYLQLLSGTLWMYGGVLGMALVFYFLGRQFGLAFKGLFVVIALLIVIYVLGLLGPASG